MNSYFVVEGGVPINGETRVQGAKNSVLPILAACVLTKGENVIHNCPQLSDVTATENILNYLGAVVRREGRTLLVDSTSVSGSSVPDSLMREMRSSVIFLGAMLALSGYVTISSPGGCDIGLRPIDLHLDAMQRLGAEIETRSGNVVCTCPNGLRGAKIALSFPSVGATENIMLAASTAKGTTVIVNAAREPEISDLADFLNRSGAKISGAGEGTMIIEGVKKLYATEHTVIPDRIAAGTFLAAAAATSGKIQLSGIIPAHLEPVINVFSDAGCDIEVNGRNLRLRAPKRLNRVKSLRTMPYPGFPTDIQAPVAAMLCRAKGTSVLTETIFENRFKYTSELIRMGAKIMVDGSIAVIEGTDRLVGCSAVTPDLRGGAAIVVAALSAEGCSHISGIKHIDRGYEKLEDTLCAIGAKIKRTDENESIE